MAKAPGADAGQTSKGKSMKIGYLKKDRQERFNLKRAWFVNAWRIVDAQGRDMVQPWPNTKTEAHQTAKALGIRLVETYPAASTAQQGEGEKS